MVICDIRANIEARDEWVNSQKDDEKGKKKNKEVTTQFNHVYLGSLGNTLSILALERTHESDPAFHGFRTKLTTCIRDLVSREDEDDRLATSERIASRDVNIGIVDEVSIYSSCLTRELITQISLR